VRYSFRASLDLKRLRDFLASKNKTAAERAKKAITSGIEVLEQQPYAGKTIKDMPEQFREWTIKFGKSGYAALYHADDNEVTILAIRHQKESGYTSLQTEP